MNPTFLNEVLFQKLNRKHLQEVKAKHNELAEIKTKEIDEMHSEAWGLQEKIQKLSFKLDDFDLKL